MNKINLENYAGEDRILPASELLEIITKHKKQSIRVKTKIPTLDNLVAGFKLGDLNIISGTTGNGKTLLAQTLTKNFAQQGVHCLFFSYEVVAEQFIRNFGLEIPLFYMPKSLIDNSLKWLRFRIIEAMQKYNVKVVFIDHLHYLIDLSSGYNMSIEIGRVVRELKKMALEFEIIIFLIAHTIKTGAEKELDLIDIRDSGLVACEADNVLFIWRKDIENEATLKISKNREFGVVNKKVNLVKKGNFFVELDKKGGDKK